MKKIQFFTIFLLTFLWGLLTIQYIISLDWSTTNVSSYHFNSITSEEKSIRLFSGKSVKGIFTATDNNLGVVSIRFETYERPSYQDEDTLIFKLKEIESNKWHYENSYRIGLIYDISVFPFGFPVIRDSKGKTYEYTITSLSGNLGNSVSIKNREPVVSTKYVTPKQIIFRSFSDFINFIYKKFILSFINIDIAYSSFVYSLPILLFSLTNIIYYFVIIPQVRVLSKSKYFYLYLKIITYLRLNKLKILFSQKSFTLFFGMLILSLYDILYLQLKNDGVYIMYIVLLYFLGTYGNLKISYLITTALVFIIAASIPGLWNLFPISEQFSIYALLYFIVYIAIYFKKHFASSKK